MSAYSISILLEFLTKPNTGIDPSLQKTLLHRSSLMRALVTKLWSLLDPTCAFVHFQVAKCFVDIYALNRNACNSVISEFMQSKSLHDRIQAHQNFALLWRLTGKFQISSLFFFFFKIPLPLITKTYPDEMDIKHEVFVDGLFLMLDAIRSEQASLKLIARSWTLSSLPRLNRILDPLILTLVDQEMIRRSPANSNKRLQSCFDFRFD